MMQLELIMSHHTKTAV